MTDINDLEMPESFTVSESLPVSNPNKKPGKPHGKLFQHDGYVFRAGQTYQLEDFPLIDKAEVFMFWQAGWVDVPDWPDNPGINTSRVVTLDVQSIKVGHAASDIGV